MTEHVHQLCVELPLKLVSGYWIRACASSAYKGNLTPHQVESGQHTMH